MDKVKKCNCNKVGHTSEKKTVVHVPFTMEAWKMIKEKAASTGMSAATFVRVASLAACDK